MTPLWVVFGLAMGPAVALGLARFAYALLLPSMRTDRGWSFADAGAMNTANAAGYLAGALDTAFCLGRIGTDNVDVEFMQRPAELRHAVPAGRVLLRDTKMLCLSL
jgi:hypothetical protein